MPQILKTTDPSTNNDTKLIRQKRQFESPLDDGHFEYSQNDTITPTINDTEIFLDQGTSQLDNYYEQLRKNDTYNLNDEIVLLSTPAGNTNLTQFEAKDKITESDDANINLQTKENYSDLMKSESNNTKFDVDTIIEHEQKWNVPKTEIEKEVEMQKRRAYDYPKVGFVDKPFQFQQQEMKTNKLIIPKEDKKDESLVVIERARKPDPKPKSSTTVKDDNTEIYGPNKEYARLKHKKFKIGDSSRLSVKYEIIMFVSVTEIDRSNKTLKKISCGTFKNWISTPPFTHQKYTNGDLCGTTQQRRKSLITFECGTKDRIVHEPRIEGCLYFFTFESKSACSLIVKKKKEPLHGGDTIVFKQDPKTTLELPLVKYSACIFQYDYILIVLLLIIATGVYIFYVYNKI